MEVAGLVDTGATHALLPRELLAGLGVEPVERMAFLLADERTSSVTLSEAKGLTSAHESMVEYDVGEARLRLDGRERTSLVVFGPEGSAPLLGATTLELFNLGVDPVGQRLIPVSGLLK